MRRTTTTSRRCGSSSTARSRRWDIGRSRRRSSSSRQAGLLADRRGPPRPPSNIAALDASDDGFRAFVHSLKRLSERRLHRSVRHWRRGSGRCMPRAVRATTFLCLAGTERTWIPTAPPCRLRRWVFHREGGGSVRRHERRERDGGRASCAGPVHQGCSSHGPRSRRHLQRADALDVPCGIGATVASFVRALENHAIAACSVRSSNLLAFGPTLLRPSTRASSSGGGLLRRLDKIRRVARDPARSRSGEGLVVAGFPYPRKSLRMLIGTTRVPRFVAAAVFVVKGGASEVFLGSATNLPGPSRRRRLRA